MPDFSDWRMRDISWWRAQTTRYVRRSHLNIDTASYISPKTDKNTIYRYITRPSDRLLEHTKQFFLENLVRYLEYTSVVRLSSLYSPRKT
jgi:hypothetical protein